MGRIAAIAAILVFAMTLGVAEVSAGTGDGGHSFEWFRDADGDGIPNGLDADWLRPEDGSGYMNQNHFWPFLSVAMTLEGDKVRHQYHNQHQKRNNKPDDPGDHLRARLRNDSCK